SDLFGNGHGELLGQAAGGLYFKKLVESLLSAMHGRTKEKMRSIGIPVLYDFPHTMVRDALGDATVYINGVDVGIPAVIDAEGDGIAVGGKAGKQLRTRCGR